MPTFIIPTRQKADGLFETSEPLLTGGVFLSDVAEVSGYAKVSFFASSDQPFGLNVEEAVSVKVDGSGNFVQTDPTFLATLAGGIWSVTARIQTFGRFMKVVLGNLGADMSFLSFQGRGVPLP